MGLPFLTNINCTSSLGILIPLTPNKANARTSDQILNIIGCISHKYPQHVPKCLKSNSQKGIPICIEDLQGMFKVYTLLTRIAYKQQLYL